MDWTAQRDNYCERTDFTFWAEPVNAVTNAAFLIAALVVWWMLRGRHDDATRLLLVILVAIGVGSFLFHTYATVWAGTADVLPILVFILVYLYYATVRFLGQPWWAGMAAVIGYFPFGMGVSWALLQTVGRMNGSITYAPVALLIAIYALILMRRAPQTARGLGIGVGILCLSLFFRTIDEAVCGAVPLGTHFLWHILNGVMLGWMILVMARHTHRETSDA